MKYLDFSKMNSDAISMISIHDDTNVKDVEYDRPYLLEINNQNTKDSEAKRIGFKENNQEM